MRVCVFVYWICSGRLLLTLTDGQDRGAASVSGDSEGSGIICAYELLLLLFGEGKISHKAKGTKEQKIYCGDILGGVDYLSEQLCVVNNHYDPARNIAGRLWSRPNL